MRRLSSPTTVLFKFVWPLGFLGFIGSFLAQSLLGGDVRWGSGITPFWGEVILSVVLLVGIAMTLTFSVPLKQVDSDGETLLISNYLWRDRVPLANVAAVTVHGEFRHNERPTVKVRFRERTKFGRRILFIAATPELLEEFFASLGPDVPVRR